MQPQQDDHHAAQQQPIAVIPSRRQLLASAAAVVVGTALPAALPCSAGAEGVLDGQGETVLLPLSAADTFTANQKQILAYNRRTQRQNGVPPDFPAFVREGYNMIGGLTSACAAACSYRHDTISSACLLS